MTSFWVPRANWHGSIAKMCQNLLYKCLFKSNTQWHGGCVVSPLNLFTHAKGSNHRSSEIDTKAIAYFFTLLCATMTSSTELSHSLYSNKWKEQWISKTNKSKGLQKNLGDIRSFHPTHLLNCLLTWGKPEASQLEAIPKRQDRKTTRPCQKTFHKGVSNRLLL